MQRSAARKVDLSDDCDSILPRMYADTLVYRLVGVSVLFFCSDSQKGAQPSVWLWNERMMLAFCLPSGFSIECAWSCIILAVATRCESNKSQCDFVKFLFHIDFSIKIELFFLALIWFRECVYQNHQFNWLASFQIKNNPQLGD